MEDTMNTSQKPRTTRPRRGASARPPRRALPHPRFTWYAGVVVMAALEIVEWPLALVMMIGHEIAHRSHNEALRDFAEGIESGA